MSHGGMAEEDFFGNYSETPSIATYAVGVTHPNNC